MSEQNNDQHEYSTSATEVAQKLKNAKMRITAVTIAVAVLICAFYFVVKWREVSDVDYIEGNVLKIARTGNASTGIVWKSDSFVSQLTWSTLFETDATFTEINPQLADSINVSSDGLTYTIVLKDGLKWSDGQPLTLDDVVFSIESALLCETAHNVHSIPMQQILGVEDWKLVGVESWKNGGTHSLEGLSVSGNTLTITMANPYTSFPMALTQFAILPEHILNVYDPSTLLTEVIDFYINPVCSGMYMVDCVNEDGDLEMIHNPYYHAEHSEIERVILYGAYQTMYIDYHTTSTLADMVSYRNMSGFDEYNVNVLFYRYFVFNLMGGYENPDMVPQLDDDGNEVFDDDGEVVLVAEYGEDREENLPMQNYLFRQAVSLAIDRYGIAKDVYIDNANADFSLTGDDIYNEFLANYDLEKAKALLIESGYDLERPFRINYYHSDANSIALLARVKEALESIGLTVEVDRKTGNVNMYEVREYDMLLKGYAAQNQTEWYVEYLTSSSYVQELVGTDEFDELMLQLEGATNLETYNKVWAEMQELDRNTMYRIPVVTTNDCTYINANRISVPDDMEFGNRLYRSDLRLDEWYVKKA